MTASARRAGTTVTDLKGVPDDAPPAVGRRVTAHPGTSLRLAWVNGQPGAVMYDAEQRVVSVIALDIADGAVQAIWSVVNPDKLGHVGPVSDLALRWRG